MANLLPMHNKVHVQCTSIFRRHKTLNSIVEATPPVHRAMRKSPHPLQDPERVHVDRKEISLEAVQKDASGSLPRQPVKTKQYALRSDIVELSKVV